METPAKRIWVDAETLDFGSEMLFNVGQGLAADGYEAHVAQEHTGLIEILTNAGMVVRPYTLAKPQVPSAVAGNTINCRFIAQETLDRHRGFTRSALPLAIGNRLGIMFDADAFIFTLGPNDEKARGHLHMVMLFEKFLWMPIYRKVVVVSEWDDMEPTDFERQHNVVLENCPWFQQYRPRDNAGAIVTFLASAVPTTA